MKLKNVTIATAIILYFISINSIASAKDCSEYKKLSHKWLMCSAGKDNAKNPKSEDSSLPEDETAKENKLSGVKSSVGGFFKKIKNFGGKNIGEEG